MKFKLHKLIGIGIFIYIVYKVNCLQVLEILSRSNPFWLLFAFLMSIPQILIKSTRWKYILKIQGYNLTLKDAFLYYLSGIYLGIMTPGRIGELSKAIYLKQAGVVKNIDNSFSSVIVDRLFDLYVLSIFSMLGIIYFDLGQVPAWWGMWGLGISIFIPFLFCNKKFTLFLYEYISIKNDLNKQNKKSMKYNIHKLIADIILLINFKLLTAGILTILSYIIFCFQCVLISLSMAISISYFEIFYGMAIANLFSMLPITIAGIGTREALLCLFLGQNGVTTDEVVAYSIGILVVFYIGGAILGLISWWLKPLYFETEARNR